MRVAVQNSIEPPLQLRRWSLAPWGAGLVVLALTSVLFLTIRKQEQVALQAITRTTGQQIQRQFEIWFGERRRVLEDLAVRWSEIADEASYRAEAQSFLTWFRGFQALSWLNSDGVAVIVEPLEGNESVVGRNLHQHPDPTVSEALTRAAATGEVTRTGVLLLTQGGIGFGTYTPIHTSSGETLGFINGVFRVDRAFQECLETRELRDEFGIVLSESGREVFRRGETAPGVAGASLPIVLFDRPITMRIVASPKLILSRLNYEAYIVLLIGSVAAAFAGFALHFRNSREWQRRVEEARRSQLERELQQAHKMESIGRLAGGIAHDFNNYLTVILGSAEMVLQDLPEDDPNRSDVELCMQAGKKAAKVTGQLLAFARKQAVEPKVIAPNVLILETQSMLKTMLGDDVEIKCSLDPDLLRVLVDPVQFDQILVNLALNARDAMPEGGVIEFLTQNVELSEASYSSGDRLDAGSYVAIEVRDSGVGMGAEERALVFEPFYSTKDKGHGTGLGLATCYGIVSQAGGHIEVASTKGEGTQFRILLPAQDSAPTPTTNVGLADPTHRAEGTVLLVEDEPLVRAVAEGVLAKAGYEVHVCEDGLAALEFAESYAGDIDLLLTDMVMPRLGGRGLALQLSAARPEMLVVFMSGYADEACDDGDAFLAKPFAITDLLSTVAVCLASRARA